MGWPIRGWGLAIDSLALCSRLLRCRSRRTDCVRIVPVVRAWEKTSGYGTPSMFPPSSSRFTHLFVYPKTHCTTLSFYYIILIVFPLVNKPFLSITTVWSTHLCQGCLEPGSRDMWELIRGFFADSGV